MKLISGIWEFVSELFGNIPLGFKLTMVILVLVAAGLFWLVRALGKKVVDSHFETLDSLKSENKRFEEKLKRFKKDLDCSIDNINDDSLKMKRASLEFQKEVNKEITYLRKLYLDMEAAIDKVSLKADNMHKKFEEHFSELEEAFERIEESYDRLAELQTKVNGNTEAISRQKEAITTLVKRLGNDTIIIKQKKTNDG